MDRNWKMGEANFSGKRKAKGGPLKRRTGKKHKGDRKREDFGQGNPYERGVRLK